MNQSKLLLCVCIIQLAILSATYDPLHIAVPDNPVAGRERVAGIGIWSLIMGLPIIQQNFGRIDTDKK
ncbi:hypothetical protein GGR55DRAFT_663268 [Xylaria sp. FL0064]|nr:hypothetical protein GGR55DRAFT_663268 [Xylaria sp. FL0064]